MERNKENRNYAPASRNKNNFKKMNDKIGEFCNNKNSLKGTVWDEYRKIVESLQEPIHKIENLSNDLAVSLSNLQNDISDCMNKYSGNKIKYPGKFGSNPATALANVGSEISICKRNINNLENSLYVQGTIYDPILGAITGPVIDKNVQYKLEKAREYLDNLLDFEKLAEELLSLKNKYYAELSNLSQQTSNIDFTTIS